MSRELGLQLGQYNYPSSWLRIMNAIELRDVLDSVTIRYQCIDHYDEHQQRRERKSFLAEARRIFQEEQVRYRIDDEAGVHFAQDSEFERMRVSTIASLTDARFDGVRAAFDEAFVCLDRQPVDGKGGLRSAFFASEALFRLMFPTAHQLSGGEVRKHLQPLVDAVYAAQKPAIYLAQKQVQSFTDWIDGAHFYRHEPGTEDPAQPPLELAIFMISQAGGFIRWLAFLDAKRPR
ncbi:hypothetical protein GTW51_19660 [Aurantimonas aggregata]|uniref:Uncharacterized protein n=1 Tax=Aurantimonas aggregata TaxID=2047720 RepID=A0A6L9MM38_9HYPH|nr:hypothetical protein [Aurantimonas aggregata]NDV88907.1 hypothetical protein [Aurantimonas aggregata]